MSRLRSIPPDVAFRLLGYGGLGAIGLARLATGAAPGGGSLLGFALGWPLVWWLLVRGRPDLRAGIGTAGRLAHALECLLVMLLLEALGVPPWLGVSVALLLLTGVSALGGLALLGPCLLAVLPVLLLDGTLVANAAGLEPVAGYLGAALVFGYLLSLALLCFRRVRRLDVRHRLALTESAALRHRNARMARYLPDEVEPLIRARPARLNRPREQFASVAFVDMVGFVDLVATRPLAELVDVVNDFLTTVDALAERRDGRLAKFLGDGLLVYFPEGPGRAPEERWRTAAGCARLCLDVAPALEALGRRWRRHGIEVDIRARAGIASGFCAIGDWGGSRRLDYTLIGTPVNLASRLQSAAVPGGVLVAASSARLIRQDEQLAGLIGPVRCVRVKGIGSCRVHALGPSANVRANQAQTREPSANGQDLPQGLPR